METRTMAMSDTQQLFMRHGDDEHLIAHIEIGVPTTDDEPAPDIKTCRYAVLTIKHPPCEGWHNGYEAYVTYDRLLSRIVNGVWMNLEMALDSARNYNEDAGAPQDMSPNGDALGLVYPDPPTF